MADDKRGPSGPPGGKRRRPPTTIDLKATELASDPVKSNDPIDPPHETPRADAPPAAASVAAEPKVEPPREPPPPPPPRPRPRTGGWPPEWLDLAAVNDRVSALRAQLAERMNWRLIAAAAAGAAAMLVVFVALWVLGAASNRDDLTVTLAARLAILELQVRDLAAKPLPAGLDQRALADLAARVGAAEQAMGRLAELDARVGKAEATAAAPRPVQTDEALTARVAALEAAVRPLAELGQRIEAAGAASRDAKNRADAAFEAAQKNSAPSPVAAADHKEIEALGQRVVALEQAAKSAEEKIARAAVSAGADRAGRLAFVAVVLRSAVERGEPFAQELAAAKPLVPNAAALSSLEPFAATGVPRAATLARELSQLTNAMLNAAGNAPRDAGFIDRLQQNAERLVRIRPINEAPGDDAGTIVGRAEAKAAHGDLAGALSELARLPDAMRAPAQAWIKRAEAQVAALAAARGLAENAVGALGKAAP
jgi:hypothetical protein